MEGLKWKELSVKDRNVCWQFFMKELHRIARKSFSDGS